jgi:hypothetical protein
MGRWRRKRVLRLELERNGTFPGRDEFEQHYQAWYDASVNSDMSIADYVEGLKMPPEARYVTVHATEYVILSWIYPRSNALYDGGVLSALPQAAFDAAKQAARQRVRELGGKPWF